jgi:quinoprotein glucose dehydrogenase
MKSLRTAVALILAGLFAFAANTEWAVNGGDPGSSKYSPLSVINTSNVKGLKLAWQWKSGEAPMKDLGVFPGQFETTPLMIGDTLYFSTPYNRVVAVDAATGAEKWKYDPRAFDDGQPPNGTGFVHRGVAVWKDSSSGRMRILMNSRYRLIELDASTGQPVKQFGDNGVVNLLTGSRWEVNPKNYTNTSPVVVYKDLIIVGNGVADRLIYPKDPPGDVRAYNARTGKLVWTFYTVPRDGEFGADTWEKGSNNYTGHTNVWAPMTLDAERGLLYMPLSTPSNDYWGGRRLGANLFADSVVCLDAGTGVRKWHFQTVHHGLWDYDNPGPPMLVTINVDGKKIDAVVQLTKQGFAFVFDRVTGKPVWPIEERPVPVSDVQGERSWPTQPFPTKPPAFAPQGVTLADANDLTPAIKDASLAEMKKLRLGPLFTPPSMEGTLARPSTVGGADWSGGGFDPETGIVYIKVNANAIVLTPRIADQDGNVKPIDNAAGGGRYAIRGVPIIKPPYGFLSALDLNHGTLVYQKPFGDDARLRANPALAGVKLPEKLGVVGNSGLIVTKGGLLFVGGGDEAVHAVDKKTGEDLWVYPTPGLRTSGTPMTFAIGNKQYVVIAVGGDGAEPTLLAFSL